MASKRGTVSKASLPEVDGAMSADNMYGVYNQGYTAHPDDSMDISMNDTYDYQNDEMNASVVTNTTINSQHDLIPGDNVLFRQGSQPSLDSVRDCGLGRCRPGCMQKCANIKVFLLTLCVVSMLNGSLSSGYLPSVITSIEKRFELGSATSGLVAASYEFGSLVAVIFVSYFGGKRHIPHWVGVGVFVMGLGALLFSVPHFVAEKYSANRFNNVTDENVCRSQQMNKEDLLAETFCVEENSGNKLYVFIFILSQLSIGIGSTPIFTLGTTYIDNHVSKLKAPTLLAFMYAAAAVGPVVGFGLGALMLHFYVDSMTDPDAEQDISQGDPRWVGAWWAGFIVIGCCLIMMIMPMTFFPKTIHKEKDKLQHEEELEKDPSMKHVNPNEDKKYGQSIKDIPRAILRLLKNPVYMLVCIGVSCEIYIVTGFLIFLPKYLETQFNLEPTVANICTGGVAIPGAVIGILLGGYVLQKFKLKSEGGIQLTLLLNLIALCGFSGLFLLGCENVKIAGGTLPYYSGSGQKMLYSNLTSGCNSDCDCSNNDIELICGSNGVTYFSPCHAGCTNYYANNSSLSNYTNCACIGGEVQVGDNDVIKQQLATAGRCDLNCGTLVPFMVVLFFMCMVAGATQTPLLMVTMRSVGEEERAFCLGMQFVILRLLAYIPAPILFGFIIDQSCMFWKTQCDTNGACLLYNIEDFRYYYIGCSAGFKGLAASFFCIVWIVMKCQAKNSAEFNMHVVEDQTINQENVAYISATFMRDESSASFQTNVTDEVAPSDTESAIAEQAAQQATNEESAL